jgi:hypothetical protein
MIALKTVAILLSPSIQQQRASGFECQLARRLHGGPADIVILIDERTGDFIGPAFIGGASHGVRALTCQWGSSRRKEDSIRVETSGREE